MESCEVKSQKLLQFLEAAKATKKFPLLGSMDERVDALEKRFLRSVQKTETCWIWKGHKWGQGYGGIKLRQTRFRTHRLSWMLYRGDIPKNMCVCHSCDNPLCVNPKHLWLGTIEQNMKDCSDKNRNAKGEKSGASKLTLENVLEIRKIYKERKSSKWGVERLAKKFGVFPQTITYAATGKSWKI